MVLAASRRMVSGSFSIGIRNSDHAVFCPLRARAFNSTCLFPKAKLQMLDGTEAQFPTDGLDTIRQNILEIGKALAVGDDVLLQKFFCAVFKVPGVSTVDLKFAVQTELGSKPADSEYSAQNIVINTYERAIFDLTRIEVS